MSLLAGCKEMAAQTLYVQEGGHFEASWTLKDKG